ncbi:universal stress protein [Xanthobacter sediminis]
MTQPDMRGPAPRRILLATDLSARCDRALDRAVALATLWGAELVVVHALDPCGPVAPGARDLPSWQRGPEPSVVVAEALQQDLAGAPVRATYVVEQGDPADLILKTADAHGCDLIVTAVARDEILGRFLLGATVDTVLRHAKAPVLVVRQRPRHPYGGIVVAADVSAASRAALLKTAAFFPDTPFHVFHAYDPPLDGLLSDPSDYRTAFGELAAQDLEAFLAEAGIGRDHIIDVLVERGDPARLIQQYVTTFHADLVVLGTEGKGALLELLVGSTAKSVLDGLCCDALVVPAAADAA